MRLFAPRVPALEDDFSFILVSPPGGPEESPDCHFPKGNRGFGSDSGLDPGETY